MLLQSLIEKLEDMFPLTVVGKFLEGSAVRAFRSFDRRNMADDLLYVLGPGCPHPNASNESSFRGYCILYNPVQSFVSERCITIYCDVSEACFSNGVQEVFEEEYTISSWFHSIYTMAIRSRNPGELFKDLNRAFHNKYILLSSSLYVVESTLKEFPGSPFFKEQHGQQYLSVATIDHIRSAGILDRALKASSAILIDDPFFGRRMLIANIRIGSYIAGYFIAIETDRPFTRQDPSMVTFLSEVMGQMIYSNTSHLTEQYFNDEYFLQTLLDPGGYDVAELSEYMHWERYMDSKYYQFLVCSAPGDLRKKSSTHFFEQLRHIFPSCPILIDDAVVTVLLSGSKKGLLGSAEKKSLSTLLKFHKQNGVVSFIFSDLALASSYHGHSLSLLKHLIKDKHSSHELIFMEDHYFQMLMYTLHDGKPDQSIIHPDILFLRRHDESHNSDLMNTLRAYLECNRSVAAMSKKLHINKSTGFYRINQIKDLLDDPFASSDRLFFYECAIRILAKDL